MTRSLNDWKNVERILLPCVAVALFDSASGGAYRCMQCGKFAGSSEQPKSCQDEADKWRTVEALGGKGWNYLTGEQYD